MDQTSSVNCLSCKTPYQSNVFPSLSDKALFFTAFCFVASLSSNSVPTSIRGVPATCARDASEQYAFAKACHYVIGSPWSIFLPPPRSMTYTFHLHDMHLPLYAPPICSMYFSVMHQGKESLEHSRTNKGTHRVPTWYDAHLRPFISIAQSCVCPVTPGMDDSLLSAAE